MLQSDFIMKRENGDIIKIAGVVCEPCGNLFFVLNIGENEPSFCAYCGTKFVEYTKGDNKDRFNIAGFKI